MDTLYYFFWAQVYPRLYGVFSCLSRALNVLLGGSPAMPLSGRCYQDSWMKTQRVINTVFGVFGQHHHCRGSYRKAIEESQDVAKLPQTVKASDNWK